MKLIRVGAAVLNQTPLAWEANQRNILAAIEEAREAEVSILCLPELCITGHGCEDAFYAPGVQKTALAVLREITTATAGMIVAVGLPLAHRKALFDCVALLADGHLAGFVAKRHLAGDGLYYEPRWFKPWPAGRHVMVELDGESYPLGDLHFVCGGVRLGFEICEDAWVAERPGSDLAARGIDILLNPSASHFAFGKDRIRRRFVLEGSRAFAAGYVYANLLGNEAGRIIFDGGALIAANGCMLAEGRRFSFAPVLVTTAVIDVDQGRMRQISTASFRPELAARPGEEVVVPFRFPRLDVCRLDASRLDRPDDPEGEAPRADAWWGGPYEKEEELTRALALGLWDYFRKSRARGFTVSLSGGADSSAVSCLVAAMIALGVAELGLEGLKEQLDHLDLTTAQGVRQLVRRLLVCVYQATRNSSTTTRDAAQSVAEAISAEFLEFDVDALVVAYENLVAGAIGRQLSWENDDLALQNIQARARGPGLWLLTNLRGSLLLATSNRSEAAVGYATMDGDTCGGLSPIAGIDKAFLRRWLRWMEKEGPAEMGSIPALAKVNRQQPTAELRPPTADQTDEDDLMPYDLLDAIERAAIRDKQMPLEVYRGMQVRFPNIARHQLAVWVERFFRLWCRNQWKRERYAPSFHVDDENLDPKTWCRFPILSGGFDRELAELAVVVAEEALAGDSL